MHMIYCEGSKWGDLQQLPKKKLEVQQKNFFLDQNYIKSDLIFEKFNNREIKHNYFEDIKEKIGFNFE